MAFYGILWYYSELTMIYGILRHFMVLRYPELTMMFDCILLNFMVLPRTYHDLLLYFIALPRIYHDLMAFHGIMCILNGGLNPTPLKNMISSIGIVIIPN